MTGRAALPHLLTLRTYIYMELPDENIFVAYLTFLCLLLDFSKDRLIFVSVIQLNAFSHTFNHFAMKRTFFFLLISLFSLSLSAQVVAKKTADGNYVQTEAPAKTAEQLTAGCQKSAAMFTDKQGAKHAVYLSKSGKMFYVATSKAGKPYRRYFKEVGQ